MTSTTDAKTAAPRSLTISRTFAAPRERVFACWSSAERMKRWFSPEGLDVPEAEIDFRPGGVFTLCMRMPDGTQHWMRGAFGEVVPVERLSFDCEVSTGRKRGFLVRTLVLFAVDGAGTRMTVEQSYEIYDPAFRNAVEGSAEGWRTTLDKLAREIAHAPEPTPAVRGAFTVERTFKATPAQVFKAFTDERAKSRWFAGGGDDPKFVEREMDVRPGGREVAVGKWKSGKTSRFDAFYFDVVPDRRLVYAYEMHLDARKISVSLACVEIEPHPVGVRLKVSEQAVFLDGYDDAGSREHGTNYLMDKLVASLEG
jgi:uncharacterized protein YndB with AHSA1/START domain